MIEQGILNPFSQTAVGHGITRPNYAIVNIGGLSQRCVVKNAGHKEIAAECFCSLLGGALGLPTLKPVIVTNPLDNSLCFGSREVGYPNLSAKLGIGYTANAAQMQALAIILSAWAHVGHVISFDELILNGDRNPGNVLWSGLAFTIIDHERALQIQPMTINKLAQFSTNNFDPAHVASVQSASMGAALAQQSMLSADDGIFISVRSDFLTIHPDVGNHFNELEAIAKKMLPSMATNTSNAMSPLFARQPR
jgi:hypothetical protein